MNGNSDLFRLVFPRGGGSFIRIFFALLVAAPFLSGQTTSYPVPGNLPANYPAWWFSQGVIRPTSVISSPSWPSNYPASDDYAAINQGQLKNMAVAAYNALSADLPASVWTTTTGGNLKSLVTGLQTNQTATDSYAAVNLGQLKYVAAPFYNLLNAIAYPTGFSTSYPWTGLKADDYSLANIGQLKYTFSFVISPVVVTISPPTTTAALVIGTPQTLQVTTSDSASGATIISVEYFDNGVLIGESETAPFNFSWIPTGSGTQVITAVATDSLNNVSAPSTAVTFTVQTDSNGSSIPDAWEYANYGYLFNNTSIPFPDGSGYTALQEYDAEQFYGNVFPVIGPTDTSSIAQTALPNTEAVSQLAVQVTNGQTPPKVFSNGWVVFNVSSGDGLISQDGVNWKNTIVFSPPNLSSTYQVYAKTGPTLVTTTVTATAETGAFTTFTVTADSSQVPQEVAGLAATPGVNSITLSWNSSTSGYNATGLEIQQVTGGVTTTLATLSPSATSYTVTGLTAGTTANLQVVSVNDSNPGNPLQSGDATPQAGSGNQPLPPPPPFQFAVIDVGANATPISLSNTGYVLLRTGTSAATYARWYNGGPAQTLSATSGYTNLTCQSIDNQGTVAGSEINSSNSVMYAASCASSSATFSPLTTTPFGPDPEDNPIQLDKVTTSDCTTAEIYGSQFEGAPDCSAPPSKAYSIKEGAYWVNPGSTGAPETAVNITLVNGILEQMGLDYEIAVAKNGHTIGNKSGLYGQSGQGTFVDGAVVQYAPVDISSTGYVLAWSGASSGSGSPEVVSPTTPKTSTIIPSSTIYSINHAVAYTSGSTTPIECPQVVGFAFYQMNPSNGTYSGQLFSSLIDPTSGWSGFSPCTSPGGINDAGEIIGTATASGTNPGIPLGTTTYTSTNTPPSAGSHGVLLLPLQLKLLNGSTQDFDGSTPTTLIPAPENPNYATEVQSVGSASLGVQPMGQGRVNTPALNNNAYTYQTLVAAKAPVKSGIQYQWKRYISRRSWYIRKIAKGTAWDVTWRSSRGTTSPSDDTGPPDFYNTTPSPIKNEFYFEDNSALGYGLNMDKTSGFMHAGDYIHEEKAFLYLVQFSFDGTTWTDGVSTTDEQSITVQYKATGGTAVTDWVGSPNLQGGNTFTQGAITPVITVAKVRAIVGGNLPINIDPNANNQ